MRLCEVELVIQAGGRVHREAEPEKIIRGEYRGPGIMMVGPDGLPLRWQPSKADLIATDWQVAPVPAR